MTKENTTHIVAIIDRSGSMATLAEETIQGFNAFLAEQKKEPGEATLTLATFASDYRLVHDGVALDAVPDLNRMSYQPAGYTALLDAVAKTVNAVGAKLSGMKEEDRPSKVLVLIMTDGEENSSREFKHTDVSAMITHQKEKYSWEFVFIGANIDSVSVGASIGIAAANSYNYNATKSGSSQLFRSVSKGVSSYRGSSIGSAYSMQDPTDQNVTLQNDLSADPNDLSVNNPVTVDSVVPDFGVLGVGFTKFVAPSVVPSKKVRSKK